MNTSKININTFKIKYKDAQNIKKLYVNIWNYISNHINWSKNNKLWSNNTRIYLNIEMKLNKNIYEHESFHTLIQENRILTEKYKKMSERYLNIWHIISITEQKSYET